MRSGNSSRRRLTEQANITEANADEKLKAIATASGANGDEIAACAAKPDTKARVEASIALGKSVGVNGTPTLFINGRNLPGGAPVDLLKKIVDFQASQEIDRVIGPSGRSESLNHQGLDFRSSDGPITR